MSGYPVLGLDREAAAALETVVTGYGNAVVDVLAVCGLDEPIAYLCLSPGQEEGMDTLPLIYAGRAVDRERMISEGLDDWIGAWNPYAMRDEGDLVHPACDEHGVDHCVALGPEVVQAWEVVRGSIEARCLDSEYWVHRRVAHTLNRRPLPLPATDDSPSGSLTSTPGTPSCSRCSPLCCVPRHSNSSANADSSAKTRKAPSWTRR